MSTQQTTFFTFSAFSELPVYMDVKIESLLNIDEVHSLLQVQLQISLTWQDQRLEFVNLKPDGNQLTEEHKRNLWLPKLIIPNTKEKITVSFDGNNSTGRVKPIAGKKGKRTDLSYLRQEKFFHGRNW